VDSRNLVFYGVDAIRREAKLLRGTCAGPLYITAQYKSGCAAAMRPNYFGYLLAASRARRALKRPIATYESRSVCLLVTAVSPAKRLNRSRYRLGRRLGWDRGTDVLDGDPDTPDKGAVIYLWIYISWPIIKYRDYPGAVEFGGWQQRCGLFDVTVLQQLVSAIIGRQGAD